MAIRLILTMRRLRRWRMRSPIRLAFSIWMIVNLYLRSQLAFGAFLRLPRASAMLRWLLE